jgi:hypothetical protein
MVNAHAPAEVEKKREAMRPEFKQRMEDLGRWDKEFEVSEETNP